MTALKLGINAVEEELASVAETCRREGIGIEVTAFAFPKDLDKGLKARTKLHAGAVQGIQPVSSHGPFVDLYASSSDPEIVRVCRERHTQALQATRAIGASIYIAHLNSLPMIRNPRYLDRFVPAVAEFWTPLAREADKAGMTIVLENLWESGPELQKRVVEEVGSPALKASFDNGHALVFSDVPASEWIEVLGEDLAHCHLHDNYGDRDEHLVVGQGNEDWKALLGSLVRHAPDAFVVMENDALEPNLRSLDVVRELLADAT